ncbi:hypothetical protein BSP239C_03813 [Brevibacterium sp. 239c]|nr:hypothetical protein BSP239C_03813 [Brevibacterium sp. 239c]
MRNSEHITTNVTGEDLTSVVQRLRGTVIDLHPTGGKRLDPLNGLSVAGGCSEAGQRTDRSRS